MLNEIGTVVLLKASSVFNELSLGVNKEQKSLIGKTSKDYTLADKLNFTPSTSIELRSIRLEIFVNQLIVANLISKCIKICHEFYPG